MRPLRALLLILCSVFFSSLLLFLAASIRSGSGSTFVNGSGEPISRFRAMFSFQNPASLFLPTATITLTDDNSTSFAAMPAAFGPLLPKNGLSGQIWIGSGFEEESLEKAGVMGPVEGELGCGDIPGWFEENNHFAAPSRSRENEKTSKDSTADVNQRDGDHARSKSQAASDTTGDRLSGEDNTDNHLHRSLAAAFPHSKRPTQISTSKNEKRGREYADIQTMQESAEIEGKIVLLSRGGCGFAEKIKWAQRRGARAVIVGDDLRGGPLIRMYAHGDTSNVTVPSLFTSHMTAHLLASLIPSGLMLPPRLKIPKELPGKSSSIHSRIATSPSSSDPRTFTQAVPQATAEASSRKEVLKATRDESLASASYGITEAFLESLGFKPRSPVRLSDSISGSSTRSPHRRKRFNWRRVRDFEEDDAWKRSQKREAGDLADGFVIGVHDWRDPDVVSFSSSAIDPSSASPSLYNPPLSTSKSTGKSNYLKGGSITPGSGVYEQIQGDKDAPSSSSSSIPITSKRPTSGSSSKRPASEGVAAVANNDHQISRPHHEYADGIESHEGLWVTLSPTNMNASPFFNTLFVLVVSPLVTLAAVYAMLLLRSRIRRRRWRAPKSVVERLPVRIYHALSNSTRSNSSNGSPHREPPTQTTPLLSDCRPVERPLNRVRSQTICGSSGTMSSPPQYGSLGPSLEKIDSGLSRWRRRYGNKQVECVVCLEEYIDGVSKVMSLPCGHEFHVDCITPWLTTRRRTCPICKGDVVRSMRRGSDASQSERTVTETEDEIQAQAAQTSNLSPSASIPVSQGSLNELIGRNTSLDSGSVDQQPSFPTSWLGRSVQNGLFTFGAPSSASQDGDEIPDRDR